MLDERIMVYGGAGSGKSHSHLCLARSMPESMFYVIDTDKAINRMLRTEFTELKNVIVMESRNWNSCEEAAKDISSKVRPEDWLVVDMLDVLWDFVQAHYVQHIFHKNIDDYFIQARQDFKGGKNLEALKGWVDWVVINKIYQDLVNSICYNIGCNIFVTAKASKLESIDDASLMDSFSIVRFKPEGEKRNAHRVHTIIYLNHDPMGFYATTIKDRGRKPLDHERYDNFSDMYQKVINGDITVSSSRAREGFSVKVQKANYRWADVFKVLGVSGFDDITDYSQAWNKVETELIKTKSGGE